MKHLTVKLGKSKTRLRKSKQFIGLKTNASRSVEATKDLESTKEVMKNLGGFQLMDVNEVEDVDGHLDTLRARDYVDVGTHVYEVDDSDKPIIATGELYVVFADKVDEEERQVVFDEFSLEVIERRSETEFILRVTAESPNPLKVAYYLEDSSLVRFAEPDVDTVLDEYDFRNPTEDLFNRQWHLQNNGFIPVDNYPTKKGADAKVVDAWKRLKSKGSSDIVIAVVDNGFDINHQDLKGNIVHPFDFWSYSSTLPHDGNGRTHGTPCAGVALGRENGRGVIGAAPNAKFMPLSGTSFDWRTTEDIFKYCIEKEADIISCSWGTTDSRFALNSIKEKAITKAATEGRKGKGCVILYAVGNEGKDYISYYAAHPDVIAVGASTSRDEHAFYSNQGPELTVVAPSNGDWPIIAPRANWDPGHWFDNISRGDNGKYKHFGGTSSATPLVAGICALMLTANPDLTAKEVKEILIKTADKIGSPTEYDSRGHSRRYGHGRVNADKAVAEALRRKENTDLPPPVVVDNVQSGRGLFKFDVTRQQSTGYGVQIGVFAEYGNVLIQAEKLKRLFNQPIIVNINELNGRTVYKVIVGQFTNRSSASNLQRTMSDKGVDGFVKNLKTLK